MKFMNFSAWKAFLGNNFQLYIHQETPAIPNVDVNHFVREAGCCYDFKFNNYLLHLMHLHISIQRFFHKLIVQRPFASCLYSFINHLILL